MSVHAHLPSAGPGGYRRVSAVEHRVSECSLLPFRWKCLYSRQHVGMAPHREVPCVPHAALLRRPEHGHVLVRMDPLVVVCPAHSSVGVVRVVHHPQVGWACVGAPGNQRGPADAVGGV